MESRFRTYDRVRVSLPYLEFPQGVTLPGTVLGHVLTSFSYMYIVMLDTAVEHPKLKTQKAALFAEEALTNAK